MSPDRQATLRDVAAEAGVSVATVSRVISGADPVRAETAHRVRMAMGALSFSPNRLAQSLRRKKTNNIGLVLSDLTNQFFFELIAQTVSTAKEAGYSVLVTGDEDPEHEALKLVGERIIDGLVFVAATEDEDVSSRLADIDVPIVCFDRAPARLECPVFRVDNVHGAATVTEHLLSNGARRVAHITGPGALEVTRLRLDGYRHALECAGVHPDPSLLAAGDFSEASGASAMDHLLDLTEPPDAVFAANDLMAIGAMRRASERGFNVPADLLVAGFDGLNVSQFTVPGLTTYAQPIAHMARRCVSRLLDLVQAHELHSRREVVSVGGDLQIRESSAAVLRKESM